MKKDILKVAVLTKLMEANQNKKSSTSIKSAFDRVLNSIFKKRLPIS